MAELTPFHIEKLEVLAGARGSAAKGKSAIRVDDLLPLLALPKLKSVQVAAPPSAAEFNTLLSDLIEMHSRLFAIAETLRQAKK